MMPGQVCPRFGVFGGEICCRVGGTSVYVPLNRGVVTPYVGAQE